jgi:hypothetical protein
MNYNAAVFGKAVKDSVKFENKLYFGSNKEMLERTVS